MARRRFVAHLLLATLLVSSSVHAQDDASPRASGTAFAVHATGKLLTNSHVIEGCTEITVVRPGGMPTRGRVQAADGRNDLALIAIDSPLTSLATFRRSPIRAGEDVIALGFPLHGLLAASLNVSRGIVSATAGLLNDTAQLQFSAGVQPGNSGGPLLDASGQVAGIVVAKLDALVVARAIGDIPQNVNFAIKTEVAEMFLRTHGLEPRFATTPKPIDVPDAVEQARSYTFLVQCVPDRVAAEQKATADLRQQQQDRERQVAEINRKAAEIWAAHDTQSHACIKPSHIGTYDWDRMSAAEQWVACDAAGTIVPKLDEPRGPTPPAQASPRRRARPDPCAGQVPRNQCR